MATRPEELPFEEPVGQPPAEPSPFSEPCVPERPGVEPEPVADPPGPETPQPQPD